MLEQETTDSNDTSSDTEIVTEETESASLQETEGTDSAKDLASEKGFDTKSLKETFEELKKSKTNKATDSDDTQTSEEVKWAPSFKFKVKDKELEFDEDIKPLVTNEKIEKKIKDLYEKSHGLDEVKASREQLKLEREEVQKNFTEAVTKYTHLEKSLKNLGAHLQKDDLDSFFSDLRMDPKKVVEWAARKVQEADLPHEQRVAIYEQREREKAFSQQQEQYQSLQKSMADIIQHTTANELNFELSKSDTQDIIKEFDARVGQQGAFRNEVIKRGQYYEAVYKQSPPAGQLVAEVINLIGGVSNSRSGATQTPQGQPGQAYVPQQQKKVIPSFSGASSNKSPMRKTYASLEDLKKAREELTTN